MKRRTLPHDQAGATAIEFALLAPVFLALLFGIVEVGRLLWVKQVLTETAYSTARCAALAAPCKAAADVQSFAAARALRWGLKLDAALVAYAPNITCDGNAASMQVTISYGFASPLTGFLPMLPTTVQGRGCFPKLS
ncbi:TadE/TadG family type IV pilus assembly protein [Sphingomonas elodea]|uniref:TadE/TadG family type IV pilus assembly protein n=1 Tax=Sphingomonas elodea TaxID=179878 RepID=UPI0002630D30|nr:TadE/TadG family type IV pilus assembly protein [Sphingomonas elodea]